MLSMKKNSKKEKHLLITRPALFVNTASPLP
jgi:hypothetical protein